MVNTNRTNTVLIIFMFASLSQLALCANYWTWTCNHEKCIKQRLKPNEKAESLEVCELLCHKYSRIWPMPNGKFKMERNLVPIQLDPTYNVNKRGSITLSKMFGRFTNLINIYNEFPEHKCKNCTTTKINFNIDHITNSKLYLEVDESYQLDIGIINNIPAIYINAQTIFGARNALETLSQMIVYDRVNGLYVVPRKVIVQDSPAYAIRGLMIDTARNYLSIATIKRIIEGMAVNKLNTLHWHITDSQSFAFVSTSIPQLSDLGAYSPQKVYTQEDIKHLVEWAKLRGVRIIPEFDGPAHVGEGWQDTDLVVCFDKQPWAYYCKEPPCGQFDPTNDKLYSTLKMLYKDMIDAFNPVAFHFGGDEVNFNCWRSVPLIRKWMSDNGMSWIWESGHVELWNRYQNRTYNIFMQEVQKQIPAIMWTSTLTDKEHLHNIPNDKYIIQVWTTKHDSTLANLLKNDYRIILSNYDALYLDCGFHTWIGTNSNNWCSPYITWKTVYENSPVRIVQNFGMSANKTQLVMGSIAALWTETVDDSSADNRIWPRTAALAERVWAEPESNWAAAENRLDSHRGRMVKLGINADTLVPEWCNSHQGSCS